MWLPFFENPKQASSKVIDYCMEEVRRQGHDVEAQDGIKRVGWMVDGWSLGAGLEFRGAVAGIRAVTLKRKPNAKERTQFGRILFDASRSAYALAGLKCRPTG